MKYEKPPLSIEAQADRLIERGLQANRSELVQRLSAVSYYRLAGYLHPYRLLVNGELIDHFQPGTNLTEVWRRYCFDRRLRGLVIDAIERIEVSVRTQLVHAFVQEHGPFGYTLETNLPKLRVPEYLDWRQSLVEETGRSRETFKKHFFDKYGDEHQSLPLWMLAELMSMGSLLTFLRGVTPDVKRKVAAIYGLPDEVMVSWLRSLNAARNHCAHHARFWNRGFGYAPMIPTPRKHPAWDSDQWLPNDRCGVLLLMCRYLLRIITPTSRWHERVEALFTEYADIPVKPMGLSENWRDHPAWCGLPG